LNRKKTAVYLPHRFEQRVLVFYSSVLCDDEYRFLPGLLLRPFCSAAVRFQEPAAMGLGIPSDSAALVLTRLYIHAVDHHEGRSEYPFGFWSYYAKLNTVFAPWQGRLMESFGPFFITP
jgi:hypothetical protein